MAADPLYAAVDDELFDAGQIVYTRKDVRTVGEMLHDADHLARQLLMDVTGEDAEALLRSWPGVVDAGAQLWGALPGRRRCYDEREVPMQRLVATTGTFQESLVRGRAWPGDGPTHGRVDQIADTLRTAGTLIDRYGADVRAEQPQVHRDISATRARVMHALYVTAHAITVALHAHGRDLVQDSRSIGRSIPLSTTHSAYAVPPTVAWFQRAATCENIARSYLADQFATAAQGEAPVPIGDLDRIPRALARWDIQSHRTLASDPNPANLAVIARTQSFAAGASLALLDAAQPDRSGVEGPARLRPAFARAGEAWSSLGSRWHDLTQPSSRFDPALHRASAELRAAYRELTHDTTTLASTEDIASRPGLDRAVTSSLQALTAGGELAYAVEEQAYVDGLTGPARVLSRRAHNDIEAGLATPDRSGDLVWVSPADIHAKRIVPVPPPVAEGLARVSAEVVDRAESAAAASTTHSALPQRHGADMAGLSDRRPAKHAYLDRPALSPAPPRGCFP